MRQIKALTNKDAPKASPTRLRSEDYHFEKGNLNATQAIKLALESKKEFWYESFSIVDEIEHIDISKAKALLGYKPEKPNYSQEQIRSKLDAKKK